MLFYFIAMRPHIEKAVGDKIYFTVEDAFMACEWINDRIPPYKFQVFQAEAVNITLFGLTSVPADRLGVPPQTDRDTISAAAEQHREGRTCKQ